MNRRRLQVKRLCFCVFIAILLVFSSGCEPGGKITFQNQRNEDVELFVTHVRDDGTISGFVDFGTISAQTTKKIYVSFLGDEWANRLEIRDMSGTVIISYDYKMADLEKIGWKIVIPP